MTTKANNAAKLRLYTAVGRWLFIVFAIFTLGLPLFAASPWENSVDALQKAFTGPIARGLSLVAIVVGGLMWSFGEADSKRMLAGIVFGVGMAVGAANILIWLFS